MSAVVEKWIGRQVSITLRSAMPVAIRGIITKADSLFVELDQGDKGMLLVPLTAILHIVVEEPRD
jgi:hypothetical protein